MSKKLEEIVLPSSPLAAQYRTDIAGWVSRDGHYYGDGPAGERTARYAGSTHSECSECSAMCDKGWTKCDACKAKADLSRFIARPRAAWDGVQMLYSEARDKYFNDPSAAADSLEDDEALEDLRLILCEPNRARLIDEDHFSDELPEDGDYHSLPAELIEAMEAYNKVAAACRPLSWSPGKAALLIEDGAAQCTAKEPS